MRTSPLSASKMGLCSPGFSSHSLFQAPTTHGTLESGLDVCSSHRTACKLRSNTVTDLLAALCCCVNFLSLAVLIGR